MLSSRDGLCMKALKLFKKFIYRNNDTSALFNKGAVSFLNLLLLASIQM